MIWASPKNLTFRDLSFSNIPNSNYSYITGLKGSIGGTNTIERINITKLAGIGIHLMGYGLGDNSILKDITITDQGESNMPSHGMDITSARGCTFKNITINGSKDNTTAGYAGIYFLASTADTFHNNVIQNVTIKNITNFNTTTDLPTSGLALAGAYMRNNKFHNITVDNILSSSTKETGFGAGINVSFGAHDNRLEALTVSNTTTYDIYCGGGAHHNWFYPPYNLDMDKVFIDTGEGNYMSSFGDKVLKYDGDVSLAGYIYSETLTTDGFLTLTLLANNDGERGMGWILLDGAQIAYSSVHWWTGGDKNIRANSCTAPVRAGTYVTVYAAPSWGAPKYTIWWFPIL